MPQVTYCILVTSDGVQMPSKSRDIAAVRINGAQSNRSFYKQHNPFLPMWRMC
jgi:hypothetical protein